MVIKKILIIAIIFISAFQLQSQSGLFDDLKRTCDLKSDEILAVTYQNPATCVKCYLEPLDLIEVTEKNKGKAKIKYIALVRCDREIELKVFRRNTGWEYYLYVDEGKARELLNSAPLAIITFFDSKGKKLLDLNAGEHNKNVEKLKKFF